MLKPRKKLTKKEIKEDKFVKTALQTRAFIEDNYKQVSIITGVVFGIIILIMVYSYFQREASEKSSAILGKAQLEYQNMNYSKARQFLNRLLDEYSGTEAADQGLFLLANLFYQENNIEQAKQLYGEFIDSYGGSEILMVSGYAGYAACLEKEERFEEAAEYYIKAAKEAPDFVEAPNYLYLAGKNYLAADLPGEAKSTFQSIVDKYEDSTRFTDAKTQLILLAKK